MARLKLALSSTASGEESKITPFSLHSGIKPTLESRADVIIMKHVSQGKQDDAGYLRTNLFLKKKKGETLNPSTDAHS